MLNSARHTAPASTLCGLATIGTGFVAAITKIFAVYLAVACLAERDAVVNVEPQIGVFGPRLDMMGVNIAGTITAMLACIVIAGIDGNAPCLKLRRKPSALTFKRFTILPYRRERASKGFARTGSGAKPLVVVVSIERLPAVFTFFYSWCVSVIPAFTRTVARLLGFAVAPLKRRAAYNAVELLTPPPTFGSIRQSTGARAELLPFVFWRKLSVATLADHRLALLNHLYRAMYYTIYADVKQVFILRRAEAEGLTVERAD